MQWNSFSNLLITQGFEVFADLLSMKKVLLSMKLALLLLAQITLSMYTEKSLEMD